MKKQTIIIKKDKSIMEPINDVSNDTDRNNISDIDDISDSKMNNNSGNSDQFSLLINVRKDVFLKLLNKILDNIGKPVITNILDFKDIEQELLVKESNIKIIESMASEIEVLFVKTPSTSRKTAKKFPLNYIKNLAKQLHMDFSYKKKDKIILVDGVSYRRSTYYYSLHI